MSIRLDERAPPAFPARRVARLRDRNRRRWMWVALTGMLAVVAATVVLVVRDRGGAPAGPVPRAGAPAPSSLVWALEWGHGGSIAIVADPADRPPVVVVVPDQTNLDLPAGEPPTATLAAVTGGGALEAAQAALDRRVGHYLLSTPEEVGVLVQRIGTVRVEAEASFVSGGIPLGPGSVTMTGAEATAYLRAGTGVTRDVRWEDVLAAVFAAKAAARAAVWGDLTGSTDDPVHVSSLLTAAHGASVIELPTAPIVGGGVAPDDRAVEALLETKLGSSVGRLVRVIVQNGNGRPGQGSAVSQVLAAAGFRVVASQNASSFGVEQTKIVARDERFVPLAEEAQRLLGAGKVYVGSQPTGISDLTIIVGKDFTAG